MLDKVSKNNQNEPLTLEQLNDKLTNARVTTTWYGGRRFSLGEEGQSLSYSQVLTIAEKFFKKGSKEQRKEIIQILSHLNNKGYDELKKKNLCIRLLSGVFVFTKLNPLEELKKRDGVQWKKEEFTYALAAIKNYLKADRALKDYFNEDGLGLSEEIEKTPLGKEISRWFEVNPDDPKKAHKEFLKGLRKTLSSKVYLEELDKKMHGEIYNGCVDLILGICKARFTENHLYLFCEDLIQQILPNSQEFLHENDFDAIEGVDPSQKLSSKKVKSKKLKGHLNIDFDPHLQGNIPFMLGTVKIAGNPVKLIRMGTPTIENLRGGAKINPEFRGYLQSLQAEGKSHLYISLQNDRKKWLFTGDESARNGAIKGLQQEFPKNFFAVVLAQDSSFYKQKDKGNQSCEGFKAEFKSQLLGLNTGFYFPDAWKEDPRFTSGLTYLLDLVHTTVFEKKEELTVEDTLDFIEVYYGYLSIFLMNYSTASNANITCKDAIDRAGKLNSLVLKLIMIMQGKADSPEHQRKHQVLTHAPAFMVKAQAIIPGRRERLMSAFNRMIEKATSIQKENIKIKVPGADTPVSLINPDDEIIIKEDPIMKRQ